MDSPSRASELEVTRRYWDAEAPRFDEAADHGLGDPAVARAWSRLLGAVLPPAPARVVDLGCGTGSISVLLGALGHQVSGLDLSPVMVELARRKVAERGMDVQLAVGDAAEPALEAHSFDVVLERHVLWALPEPEAVVARWAALLRPGGRLVLVEGRWGTGVGMPSVQVTGLLRPWFSETTVTALTSPALWGREIDDDRYLVVAAGPTGVASPPGEPPPG